MTDQPSLLSLAAGAIYFLVAALCVFAGVTSRKHRQKPGYFVAWISVAAFFGLLGLSRVFALEDQLEGLIRARVIAEGAYLQRAEMQRPVAAIFGIGSALVAILFALFARRTAKGRRELAIATAIGASMAMVGLVIIRVVSLHAIDSFLYGSLKLNWVADMGLTALVACAALYFISVLREGAR